ncbi:MAG: hypothetical protein IJ616_00250 [Bacteroidales bacterium]|nr:hypothetical protein [Bacteroidales bacterium]
MKYTLRLLKAILCLASFFPVNEIFAQKIGPLRAHVPINEGYQKALLDGLDKSRVPTGFLMDMAAEVVNLSLYDGKELTDSNFVNIFTHPFILESIKTADINTSHSWIASKDGETMNNGVPIILSLYEYNTIKSNALEDGLISLENDTVHDVFSADGKWINPYDTNYLIAGCPAFHSVSSSTVVLNLELTPYCNLPFSRIDIDADDGLGYRTFSSGEVLVNYQCPGMKEVKIRVITQSRIFYTHFLLEYVTPTPTLLNNTLPDPYERESFDLTLANGDIITAEIAVSYADTSRKEVLNPFIYVEGFDPVELLRLTNADKVHGYTDISNNTEFRDYFSSYDFIYVNWKNCEADIRDNAELLIKVLKEINRRKHLSGSTSKNVILGESMGGLIVRYALRKMELDNVAHECRTYISHDAPHLGAHVPVGYLYAVNEILSFMGRDKSLSYLALRTIFSRHFRAINKYLHSISAQQMLYNYVKPDNTIDHYQYNQLQSTLQTMGWPEGDAGCKIDKIAICNGGKINITDHLTSSSDYLNIDVTASPTAAPSAITTVYSRLAPILGLPSGALIAALRPSLISAFSFLKVHLKITPDNGDGSALCSFNYTYFKLHTWIPFPIVTAYHKSFDCSDAGDVNYLDYCEGSKYNISASLDNAIQVLQYILGGSIKVSIADAFEFIPSVSSLASPSPVNTTFSVYSDSFSTPFDSYALNANSESDIHIRWTEKKKHFIKEYLESGDISGSSLLLTKTAQYGFTGQIPKNVCWTTSNSSLAKIDSNGTLTALRNGRVYVMACYDYGGLHFRKKKLVTINAFPTPEYSIPSFTLRSGSNESGAYVEAVSDDGQIMRVDSTASVACIWYVKVDDSDMESYTSYSPEQVFRFNLGDRPERARDKILVSLRMNINGQQSDLHSIIIPYYKEFSLTQPLIILLCPDGRLYYGDGNKISVLDRSTVLVVQSDQSEIRKYLSKNAYLLLVENGHTYPNVSNEEDKLIFTVFSDPLFPGIFYKDSEILEETIPLRVQVRALLYEDELIKEFTIPIIRVSK